MCVIKDVAQSPVYVGAVVVVDAVATAAVAGVAAADIDGSRRYVDGSACGMMG